MLTATDRVECQRIAPGPKRFYIVTELLARLSVEVQAGRFAGFHLPGFQERGLSFARFHDDIHQS